MLRFVRRHLVSLVLGILLIGGIVWALLPQPVLVDLATVERGTLVVTIDEEGETEVRDLYTVSAPITGRLLRVTLDPGDRVIGGETVVATLEPVDPGFLDRRLVAERQAALSAAEAAEALAQAELQRTLAVRDLAQQTYDRTAALADRGTVSPAALDQAAAELRSRQAEVAAAQAALDVRRRQREGAEAALMEPTGVDVAMGEGEACCVPVRSPTDGVVLRVLAESETVIAAGSPVLEIGDPTDLQIVVDLLSMDAVRVAPGAPVTITDWGGPDVRARVRRVDPLGVTRVSALGIEEQRVDTVIDFAADGTPGSLGHGYRVRVEIETDRLEDALLAPLGALFREAGEWRVFRVDQSGRARTVSVTVAALNDSLAAIETGLAAGDRLVLFPSGRVADGVQVTAREDS